MSNPAVQGWVCSLGQTPSAHALDHQHDSSPPATSWLGTVFIWIARSRQRKALRELAELNDRLLQDIGVPQDEALREAAKPFWRS